MNEKKLSAEDVAALRRRVEYEDQLLNSRTSIVLTLNGLMAVAAALSLSGLARLAIAIVIILINLLWIVCALDAQHFIHSLISMVRDSDHPPIDERVRKEVQENRLRIGSTCFMSLIVPILLLVSWILGLVLTVWKP